jgi:Leucine-rich repeat (LRR) protein
MIMERASEVLLSALFLLMTSFPAFAASPYLGNVNNGVYWLSQNQNDDGSWGASDDVKLLCTMEAVAALEAANQRIPAYYWGVMWLENHCAPNSDYKARRILALASHGDNFQTDLAQLQSAQMLISPGNNGWGLTSEYQGTALDSAMALLATYKLGVTTNVQPALNYLKTAQLTGKDKGWPVAQESSSDPMTTALVVSSLANYTALDSTLTTPIANGVATLTSTVTTASSIPLRALAALAYLRSGYSAYADSLLSSIAGAQASNGSWSNDPYATAVATRAFAMAMGNAAPCLSTLVYMPDPYLRAVVNRTLGKNGMDAITQCNLANLTTLNAAGQGISNLTGMEYAVNLVSADLRNNNITDTSPLNGLPLNPVVLLAGNPGTAAPPMPPDYGLVRITRGGAAIKYYASLQEAYNDAIDGDTIQIQAGSITEGFNAGDLTNKTITIIGGYDPIYASVIGQTALHGQVTLTKGTNKFRNIYIKR